MPNTNRDLPVSGAKPALKVTGGLLGTLAPSVPLQLGAYVFPNQRSAVLAAAPGALSKQGTERPREPDLRPWGGVPYAPGRGAVLNRVSPVDGPIVQRRPGAGDGRYDPSGQNRTKPDGSPRPHRGVDWAAPVGTDVRAVADGRVVLSKGGFKDAGQQIVLETSDGYQPAYFHLDERLVRLGDAVTKGQVIGRSGTSGNARNTTVPHLHFQVRAPSGELIDPVQWIDDGVRLEGGAPWHRHGRGAIRPQQ